MDDLFTPFPANAASGGLCGRTRKIANG